MDHYDEVTEKVIVTSPWELIMKLETFHFIHLIHFPPSHSLDLCEEGGVVVKRHV